MKKLLLSMAALSMAAAASAQVADGQYCIMNKADGTWLNGGQSWGTAWVTSPVPRIFEIVNQGDGTCKIKSSCGWCKGDLYVDGGEGEAAVFEIVKEGDVYRIKRDGKSLGLNEKFDFKDGDWWNWEKACHQDTQWTLKQVDDASQAVAWDVVTLDELKSRLADASETNPMDATFFIKANNMAKNDSDNLSAWVYTVNGEKAEGVNPGYIVPDPCWIYDETAGDHWAHQDTYGLVINDNSEGTNAVEQTAEGLPAGKYTITYRVVNQTSSPLELNVNGAVLPVSDFTDSDLWYHSGSAALKGSEKSGEFTVAADGKLSIKMVKQAKADAQNRFAFKTFRIKYLGNSDTGVAGVAVDENAPVEYYSLQGVRVANPAGGIFIRKQGTKVTKVIL